MANIALDIKANTSKALGEFKKLSRELDNKFLVQGLKLDVVKNAFRQINREFEQSLGQQGFNTTETTNQLQRNAAANLAILNKLGTDAANEVTQSVRKNLQFLQAEGKITGETVKEALTAASFFDFSGSEAEIKKQFESFTNNFATVSQDLSDAFGESGAGQFQKVLTGQARLDDLFGVDFGPGGASKNLILKAIRENYGNIDAVTGEARTRLIEKILADFQDTNTEVGKILDDQRRAARRDDPFRQITRELQGLFSPQGLFGNLRQIGGTFENLDGQQVPRNLLQLTAKLIRTIFDKDEGLFAVLGKTLGDAFGFDPKNILAPILNGVELFTLVLERLRDFFASASFKKFLTVFDPLKAAIEGINFKDGLSAAEIGTFVDGLFESVRGIFKNITGFIKGINAGEVGDILGNIIGEIIDTLPALLDTVFTSITKVIDILIETINNTEFNESKLGTAIAKIADGLAALIPKVIDLVLTALPKVLGSITSAFFQADLGGKALIGGAFTEGLLRLFTGQGILGALKDNIFSPIKSAIGTQLEKIPLFGKIFSRGANERAAGGSDRQRWGRLLDLVSQIRDCVCGGNLLGAAGDLLDFRRGGRRLPGRGRFPRLPGFRTPRLPGAALRPPGNILPPVTPRVPPAPRFQAPRLPGSPVSVVPRGTNYRPGSIDVTPIRPGAPRSPVPGTGGSATTGLFRNIRNFFTQATNRIPRVNPLQGAGGVLNRVRQSVSTLVETTRAQGRLIGRTIPSVAQFARTQGASIGRVLTDYNPLRSRFRPGRTVPSTSPATIPGRTAEGIRYRAPQIPSPRVPPAAGGGGILNRILGAGRSVGRRAAGALKPIPLLGNIIAGLSIASIAAAPGAKAGELEEQGYTKEEIEKIKKQEGRNKTRGILGVLGGIGGGALAGGVVGAKLGAAGLNPFTVKVGAILGTLIGGIIGEEAVKALGDDIIDGVMGFAGQVGGFFSGLWGNISSGFSSALDGIGKFFGSEGPIQRFAKWVVSLPGNIAGGIFGAVTDFFGEDGPLQSIGKFFFDLPGQIATRLAELGSSIFESLRGAAVALPAGALRLAGFGGLADKLEGKDSEEEEEREPSPNFAGGFNLIGGRTAFNEREAIGMPDGVTYIPLTSSTTLDKFVGKTIETTNNMEVTINVNGAADPRQVAQAVIEEIDNVFKSVTSTT